MLLTRSVKTKVHRLCHSKRPLPPSILYLPLKRSLSSHLSLVPRTWACRLWFRLMVRPKRRTTSQKMLVQIFKPHHSLRRSSRPSKRRSRSFLLCSVPRTSECQLWFKQMARLKKKMTSQIKSCRIRIRVLVQPRLCVKKRRKEKTLTRLMIQKYEGALELQTSSTRKQNQIEEETVPIMMVKILRQMSLTTPRWPA